MIHSLLRLTIIECGRFWDRAYRQVLPAPYLDMLYLIFLDCELSLCRGLNRSVVSLGSETSCLWLSNQMSDPYGRVETTIREGLPCFFFLIGRA